MKTAKILNHNIWIINTLKAYGSLTFEEIRKKWQDDNMSDGNALARSSFNRYRDAIADMFGIVIDCDLKTYRYYIKNQDVLCDDSIERWLFSTLTVHGVLSDSAAVKDRVVLENVPSGLDQMTTNVVCASTDADSHGSKFRLMFREVKIGNGAVRRNPCYQLTQTECFKNNKK